MSAVYTGEMTDDSLDELRRSISFDGDEVNSEDREQQASWIFDMLRDMNLQQRSKWLEFCTSCSRRPPEGFTDMDPRLTFHFKHPKDITPHEIYPRVATCSREVFLPVYETQAELKEVALLAHRLRLSSALNP